MEIWSIVGRHRAGAFCGRQSYSRQLAQLPEVRPRRLGRDVFGRNVEPVPISLSVRWKNRVPLLARPGRRPSSVSSAAWGRVPAQTSALASFRLPNFLISISNSSLPCQPWAAANHLPFSVPPNYFQTSANPTEIPARNNSAVFFFFLGLRAVLKIGSGDVRHVPICHSVSANHMHLANPGARSILPENSWNPVFLAKTGAGPVEWLRADAVVLG